MAKESSENLIEKMIEGMFAERKAEAKLADILGIDILGVAFDYYDTSFEIYPVGGYYLSSVSKEEHAAILDLGCHHYWIVFDDGSEIYNGGERSEPNDKHNRWQMFDNDRAPARSLEARYRELLSRLGADGHDAAISAIDYLK